MAYRLNSEGASNWVKASLGLTITKEAFHGLIQRKFESFADEIDVSNHLPIFIQECNMTKIQKRKLHGKTTWTICISCCECQAIINAVAENHTNRNRINWENIKNDDPYVNIPRHWTLAKLFMPKTSRRRVSSGPNDADALAVLEILKTCKLFADEFDIEDLLEMIEVRNDLMHSADLELSSSDTEDAFDAMNTLLQSNAVIHSRDARNAIEELEKLRNRPFLLVSSSSEGYEMQQKALNLRKESLQYDKDMYNSMGRSVTQFDDMIEKTNDQLKHLHGTPAGRQSVNSDNAGQVNDLAAETTRGAIVGAALGMVRGPVGVLFGCIVGTGVSMITCFIRSDQK